MEKLTASLMSPYGSLAITEEAGAIVSLDWKDLEATSTSPLLAETVRQLNAYFEGKLKVFDLPLEPKGDAFQRAVCDEMLAIPYGASIGGLGTPVGTPTNLIVMGYLEDEFGRQISFDQWMTLGLPVVALMLPAAWLVLTRWGLKLKKHEGTEGGEVIRERKAALGRMSAPEARAGPMSRRSGSLSASAFSPSFSAHAILTRASGITGWSRRSRLKRS